MSDGCIKTIALIIYCIRNNRIGSNCQYSCSVVGVLHIYVPTNSPPVREQSVLRLTVHNVSIADSIYAPIAIIIRV